MLPGSRRRLVVISIHAPREGCDRPKPPCKVEFIISIHAPREGCDPAR